MKSRTLTGVGQALALGLLLAGISALFVAQAADRQMDQDRAPVFDKDRDQIQDRDKLLEPDMDLDQDRIQLRDRLDVPDQDRDQIRQQDQIHK